MDVTKRIIIYTDGACSGNPGPGGWAAILIHPQTGKELAISGGVDQTTNNRMELTAAIEALRRLKYPVQVDLYSDSAYLVNAFLQGWLKKWIKNNWRSNNKEVKNIDLWKELASLTSVHEIFWHHVAGHAGIEKNEECDRLASQEVENILKKRSLP